MRKAFWEAFALLDAYLRPNQNKEPVSTARIRAVVQHDLMAERQAEK